MTWTVDIARQLCSVQTDVKDSAGLIEPDQPTKSGEANTSPDFSFFRSGSLAVGTHNDQFVNLLFLQVDNRLFPRFIQIEDHSVVYPCSQALKIPEHVKRAITERTEEIPSKSKSLEIALILPIIP